MSAARCDKCEGTAIVTASRGREREHLCAEHARPLFKEGLRSLPHHDWMKREDDVRVGQRWTCAKCGESVGPKGTGSAKQREVLELERCPFVELEVVAVPGKGEA